MAATAVRVRGDAYSVPCLVGRVSRRNHPALGGGSLGTFVAPKPHGVLGFLPWQMPTGGVLPGDPGAGRLVSIPAISQTQSSLRPPSQQCPLQGAALRRAVWVIKGCPAISSANAAPGPLKPGLGFVFSVTNSRESTRVQRSLAHTDSYPAEESSAGPRIKIASMNGDGKPDYERGADLYGLSLHHQPPAVVP